MPLTTLLWLVLALAAGTPAAAQQPAAHATEQAVYEIASELRCVVCQNLSVADSPSEMAGQMRAVVRDRLAAGESPEQVRQYFVDRYGEWILLSPRRRGFNLVVWGVPVAAVAVGLAVTILLLRRWTRTGRARAAPPAVDAAMSARIRREMGGES
ncbi:MAG TPA: cytochrome c-type biogenesis protein CcmH [Candidatus Limnocylindria bacterium]|nr:cytochrome c-type biogenesis protein CcmH [Candidatus Limnocylindria bacterium]